MGYFKEKGVDVACCPWMNFNTMKPMADYVANSAGRIPSSGRTGASSGWNCPAAMCA